MCQRGCIGEAVGIFFLVVWFCFFCWCCCLGVFCVLSDLDRSFLPKRERKRLLSLVHGTDWSDEDSVWECGVELGRFSVMLRAEVLRRGEFDD